MKLREVLESLPPAMKLNGALSDDDDDCTVSTVEELLTTLDDHELALAGFYTSKAAQRDRLAVTVKHQKHGVLWVEVTE